EGAARGRAGERPEAGALEFLLPEAGGAGRDGRVPPGAEAGPRDVVELWLRRFAGGTVLRLSRFLCRNPSTFLDRRGRYERRAGGSEGAIRAGGAPGREGTGKGLVLRHGRQLWHDGSDHARSVRRRDDGDAAGSSRPRLSRLRQPDGPGRAERRRGGARSGERRRDRRAALGEASRSDGQGV